MKHSLPILRGRGADADPPNRFDRLFLQPDPEFASEEVGRSTEYFRDSTKSVLSRNDSPDVPFEWSLNPYRGCEHGCTYCYARPTHEYLGFSAGLDFESRILVKQNAPQLLRRALARKSWVPVPLAMSGVTDPYQPIERRLGLTRRCLEVLAETMHPVSIVTKGLAIERDTDLLASLAQVDAVHVTLSITTLDRRLQRAMEPRASPPKHRLKAIRSLREAGVPASVIIAPVIPGFTEHEIPAILEAAKQAGATGAAMFMLRLPGAVEEIFVRWLVEHLPDRSEKVLQRLRDLHGGRLSDPRFGHRMRGHGDHARQVRDLFRVVKKKMGLEGRPRSLSSASFRRPTANDERPTDEQLDLLR